MRYILEHDFFECDGGAGVWLPPSEGFDVASPSPFDIKTIDTTLLAPSLDTFLFHHLPVILAQRRDQVRWHLNPLCKTCRYAVDCEARTVKTGQIGIIPNLPVEDAHVLRNLLRLGRGRTQRASEPLTDIEELNVLVNTEGLLRQIATQDSSTVKKSRRMLAIPRRKRLPSTTASPVVEAARSMQAQVRMSTAWQTYYSCHAHPQIIPRLNYTCPSSEDIAVIISFIVDPSTADTGLKSFCITVRTHQGLPLPCSSTGPGEQLIVALAKLVREINSLQANPKFKHLTTQFYVWSMTDRNILQTKIIHGALSSDTSADDIRICVGALAQGAALLQTAYQPLLLSGALLGFLSKKMRLKKEYQACLARMDLPTSGTLEECRKRVEAAIISLNEAKDNTSRTGQEQRELGQVPRVVVLKKEVERLVALPVPGYWDLPECFKSMFPQATAGVCSSEEELYWVYRY